MLITGTDIAIVARAQSGFLPDAIFAPGIIVQVLLLSNFYHDPSYTFIWLASCIIYSAVIWVIIRLALAWTNRKARSV